LDCGEYIAQKEIGEDTMIKKKENRDIIDSKRFAHKSSNRVRMNPRGYVVSKLPQRLPAHEPPKGSRAANFVQSKPSVYANATPYHAVQSQHNKHASTSFIYKFPQSILTD
jgi:hypothetical protein